jgi:hypothetical protein
MLRLVRHTEPTMHNLNSETFQAWLQRHFSASEITAIPLFSHKNMVVKVAQDQGSSASGAFRVGIELGDIRCPGRPTRFAPRRWKFGLLLSRNVHTPSEFSARRIIRRGHTGRDLSTSGLTSHKTPKNLCKRDALPLS